VPGRGDPRLGVAPQVAKGLEADEDDRAAAPIVALAEHRDARDEPVALGEVGNPVVRVPNALRPRQIFALFLRRQTRKTAQRRVRFRPAATEV
jgi:hypothetical protein